MLTTLALSFVLGSLLALLFHTAFGRALLGLLRNAPAFASSAPALFALPVSDRK